MEKMSDEKKKEICNKKAIFEELLEKYSDTEIFLEIYDYLYDVYDDDSKIPNLFSSTVIIRCKENVVVCSVSTKNTDWKSNYENFFKVFCDSSKSSSEINDSIAENAIKIAKVSYMYEKSYGSVSVNYELKGETLNVFTTGLCETPNVKNVNVFLPNNLTKISESAFWRCSSMKSIQLPDSLKIIDIGAFEECLNLESIHIPKSVEKIGACAFSYCSSLKTVFFNGTEEEWKFILKEDSNLENIQVIFQ